MADSEYIGASEGDQVLFENYTTQSQREYQGTGNCVTTIALCIDDEINGIAKGT